MLIDDWNKASNRYQSPSSNQGKQQQHSAAITIAYKSEQTIFLVPGCFFFKVEKVTNRHNNSQNYLEQTFVWIDRSTWA